MSNADAEIVSGVTVTHFNLTILLVESLKSAFKIKWNIRIDLFMLWNDLNDE